MTRKSGFWIAVWVVLVVVTGMLAFGHGSGYGPWHGWGRMGGWPERYRADHASRGYGMGPSMMWGDAESGYGGTLGSPYGMTGPYGGMLPGMGFGGMMTLSLPDLTAEQAQKITALLDESAERNRGLMQRRWEGQARLNSLYAADTRDWDAIRTATRTLLDLQRQQMDAAIDLQQKIDGVLTDSQRREMANSWGSPGR